MSLSLSVNSSPVKPEGLDIPEMYDTVRGVTGGWGVKGYRISKRPLLKLYRDHMIPKAKRPSAHDDAMKRCKDPDPATYGPTTEKLHNEYWKVPTGTFRKSPRRTVIEEIMKSPKSPGPASYDPEQIPDKKRLGIFNKSVGVSFLSDVEYLSEENPGVGQYFSNSLDREKAFGYIEKRSSGFKYSPLKQPPNVNKSVVGPGYLKDLEVAIAKNVDKNSPPAYKFGKSKPPNAIQATAHYLRNNPGIGQYKDAEKPYDKEIVVKKTTSALITKYKFLRTTEEVIKNKKWVPGPGAYDILPKFRVPPAKK